PSARLASPISSPARTLSFVRELPTGRAEALPVLGQRECRRRASIPQNLSRLIVHLFLLKGIGMQLAATSVTRGTPKALQVAAAVIGNALEWYDFIIFGFLTVVISRLFFPSESQ